MPVVVLLAINDDFDHAEFCLFQLSRDDRMELLKIIDALMACTAGFTQRSDVDRLRGEKQALAEKS